MTLDAITSGAGIGNSPKKGILNVATVSDGKVSLVSSKLLGTCGCPPGITSSAEDDVFSSAEDP